MTNVQIDQPYKVPSDRDLFFDPQRSVDKKSRQRMHQPNATMLMIGKGGVLTHVINQPVSHVQVWNASNQVVVIPAHTPMGLITDMEVTSCYLLESGPQLAATAASSTPIHLVQAGPTTEKGLLQAP
jgi:hypothetical protein